MDWLRKWTDQVQAHLSDLPVSTKMLIGMCVIFLAATLGVVALYAGRPNLVPLLDQPMDAAERSSITTYLAMRDVPHEVRGDRIVVPVERRLDVLAGLQMNQMLPKDTSHGFASLIESQSWWQSSDQNRMQFDIALQNELGAIITRMPGVAEAKVIISRPAQRGFSMTHRAPSASVNVVPDGPPLSRRKAEAIASSVAGAVAEMDVADVVVIDANAGRQYRANADESFGGDLLETVQSQEKVFREKIAEALVYIPRVIVAVTVEVESSRKQVESTEFAKETSVSLITSENTRSSNSSQPVPGGEPGVRSNTGIDITGGGAAGRTTTTEEATSEFAAHPGFKHESRIDPSGVPTRISATVNVPRSYFVNLFQQANPPADPAADAEPAPPSDADLQPLIDTHLPRIEKQVKNLVSSRDDGRVVVDVYPDAGPAVALAGIGVGGGGGVMGGPLPRTIGIAALALVSLGAMFMMVRKASQVEPVPSPADLAGLPPDLVTDNDVAGEAGSAESALMGIELDDEQLNNRQVAAQVAELVRNDPAEAASMLRRWIKADG